MICVFFNKEAPRRTGGALCCGSPAAKSVLIYLTPIQAEMTIFCTSEVPS